MKAKCSPHAAAAVLGIIVLCVISLPLKSDEGVRTNRSLLKIRMKDRVASLSTGVDGVGYGDCPSVTMWYIAEITRVQISANHPSVVVDDDFLHGTMRIMNSKSGLQEKREFEIQYDSNMGAPPPLGGFEVGMFMYIGVTKKNQLFDIYYPARQSRKK